jgi:hypothetical protein
MKRFSTSFVTLGVGLLLTISACHKEGPAEEAGREIDKAAENAGDAMKNAGRSMSEGMEEAGDRMKDAVGR